MGPLAIATRQRHDECFSVTMADNTAQIQQPKKKCPRKWKEGETTSLIELLAERPCLWNIVETSYHSKETREQGFEELKCLLFHHPQEVTPMKNLQFDDADIDATQSPPYWFLVYVRVRQRPGAHKQRHVVMNVACVWPARSITVAKSCNNVASCCVEMLRAFGQAFRELKQGRWQRQRRRQKTMLWLVEWGKIIVLHVRHALLFNSLT